LATLVPIIKDKLGDSCSSKNYRSIAISSLVLKVLDWIIIILFSVCLGLDDLQFAYQAKVSTAVCSWVVIEIVNYFLRNGSEVYSFLCDMSKAFDLVKHSVLFRKLMMSGIPMIFLRLLLCIYLLQSANVRWNSECSGFFPLTNGVKQGAVLSAILYCFYINGLFDLLRERKAGCWVKGVFYGMVGYSDDNWLLAPSRQALQEMLKTCEEYAEENNLKFSTDRTQTNVKRNALHFGLKHDIRVKRAQYIDRNNELIQEYNFAHPKTKFQMNSIFNSHFSGSQVWDLLSPECAMIESTWNRSIKLMFDLPLQTHHNFMCPISESHHVKSMLIKRFISFTQKLETSKKLSVKHLYRAVKDDAQTTTGSNIRNVQLLIGKEDRKLDPNDEMFIKYHGVTEKNQWKVNLLKELIELKHGTLDAEIEEMIEHLCTS
jgi:hypothetical protein